MKRSRRQAGSTLHRIGGFTLIELMVAMTLSLVLVAGVLAVMLNSRQTYEVHDYTADMQENARFAMYILSRELRAAGYYGCSNRLTNSIPGVLGGSVGLVSGDNGTGWGSADEFTVRFADPAHADVRLSSMDSSTQWTLSRVPASWEQDLAAQKPVYVLISDCGSTAIASLTGADAAKATIRFDTTSLGREFLSDALPINVRRLLVHTYSVALNTDGIASLMLDENLGDGPQVLVAGIENMQVNYRTPMLVQPAPLPNWNEVTSASVGLLVRSVSRYRPDLGDKGQFGNTNDTDRGSYVVLDVTFSPQADGGILPPLRGRRDTFTSSAMIRNRAGI